MERVGLRKFASQSGIPLGKIRSILAGRDPLTSTTAQIADALGLELYIGPPRATPQSSVAEEQASYRPTIKEQTPPAALEDARITTRISWLKSYWLDLNGTGRKALCTRWDSYFPEWKEEGQALCAPPSPPDNANALWKD